MLIIQHAHAMDKPTKIQKKVQRERQAYVKELITHTIALPIDIKKYIIHILPRINLESDDDFITRVKSTIKNKLPDNYYHKNLKKPRSGQGHRDPSSIPTGLCPYGTHVVVLNGNHLQIIDTRKHSIVHIENCFQSNYLQQPYYKHIAITDDTHTIATIHEEHKNLHHSTGRGFAFTAIDILTIKNILTKKVESCEIPSSFIIAHAHYPALGLAFNKQGTHIIVRGINKNLQKSSSDSDEPCEEDYDYMPHHLILPVTINGLFPYLNTYLLFLGKKIMEGVLPANANQKSKKK